MSSSESGNKTINSAETISHVAVSSDSLSIGEGKIKGEEEVSSPSPGHSATVSSAVDREKEGVTAGHVRSAIVAPAHHSPVASMTVAARPVELQPQKSVTDPTALPGTQALAVLASVSDCMVVGS